MLRQSGVVVGLSLAGLVAGSVPAFADGWGYSDCGQYPNPGCELGVGEGGRGNSHPNAEEGPRPGQSKGNPPERARPSLGGVPGGDGSSAQRLRQRLREELSARLAERVCADEDAGHPAMTPAQRRALAESVLADSAEAHAQAELARGGQLVTPEAEQRVIAAVLDEVFGLAGLEPLLCNPDIENININSDQVFVRYADGRREQLAPVMASDTELVRLIRDLAARSGVEERRFDRGSPIVNFQLPGGARASAVMALTARPSVSIRRHRLTRRAGG